MKTIFLRDYKQLIKKHPDTWNTPCVLPRDLDCGEYLDSNMVFRIDPSLKVIEWKNGDTCCWAHFDEIFITEPTKILNKIYEKNVEEL